MKVLLSVAVSVSVVVAASAATCRQYGCKRYALSNGYCGQHQREGKLARAKAAAETRETKKALEALEACRLADEKAAAEYAEATAAKERRRLERQRKESLIEQKKFEQPLDGLFGKKFGEKQDHDVDFFSPQETYRKFGNYAATAEGTNGVVLISAYLDFGSDASLVRRELTSVLRDIESKFGRKPNKLLTDESDEVWALGFGGVDGVAHQQLQVSLEPQGVGYRIVIAAFVIRNPSRTLRQWDAASYLTMGADKAK